VATELNVVTGGLSYIGKHITQRLLSQGKQVAILTGHPNRPNPFGNRVSVTRFNFYNEKELARSLHGATTLYNTYWVRFDYGEVSFSKAIEHTRRLIAAARSVGVRKIVHLSVSNPSSGSPFPNFRGKAITEEMIKQSGLAFTIIRPTLVFGGEEEILVNNIAWLLRRFPIFAIPSPGTYQLQPIIVDEVADLAVTEADTNVNTVLDAGGPEILSFEGLVRLIAQKVGSHPMILRTSPALSIFLLKIVSRIVDDVVLTSDELGALMSNLLVSKDPAIGRTRMGDWLDRAAANLGRRYASEFNRHFHC